MKKLFNVLITLALVMSFNVSNQALARNKKPTAEQKQIEYLNLDWWETFQDPQLSNYIQDLYNKNNDLKIAALRVKEGEKMVKLSLANELPHVSFDGTFGREMTSSEIHFGPRIYQPYSQYRFILPLTASYEIDIWGKNRFKTKSANKQLEMIQQDERASYILITSAFAAEYYNLVKTNKFIELQKELLELQKEITKKVEIKFENGLCTENEVINEQKLLTHVEEDLNSLNKTKAMLENQLKVYLADSHIDINTINYDNIVMPANIPDSIDSSVVANRPDYIRSEEYIKKLGYDVSVAKREFLPKIMIYGQLGFNAYEWGNIFRNNSQLATAGILPSIDLFSGGRKFAMFKLRKYQYQEALEHYNKTILTSLQEVNDSSVILKTNEENYKQSAERRKLEAKKYQLMIHKNEIGAASDLDVLYRKEQDLLVQQAEISNKINYMISVIGLYKAVGGQNLYNLNSEEKQQENI